MRLPKRRELTCLLLVLAGVLVAPSLALATPVGFEFTASVGSLGSLVTPHWDFRDYGVDIGTTLTGQLTWDTGCHHSPDWNGLYDCRDIQLSFTGGDVSFSSGPANYAGMFLTRTADRVHLGVVFNMAGPVYLGAQALNGLDLYIELYSDSPTQIPDGEAFWQSFDPTVWSRGSFEIEGPSGYITNVRASVTHMEAVPEPASLLLLGTGLAAAGLVRRRRQVVG